MMEIDSDMDKFREFQGPDLDDCIRQAMEWFASPRETLEVEIIQAAKSGIFGIVGARKAKIRVRKAEVAETMRNLLESAGSQMEEGFPKLSGIPSSRVEAEPAASPPDIAKRADGKIVQADKDEKDESFQQSPGAAVARDERRLSGKERARQKVAPALHARKKNRQPPKDMSGINLGFEGAETVPAPAALQGVAPGEMEKENDDSGNWPRISASELNQKQLERSTIEVVRNLIVPLANRDVGMQFDIFQGNPRVRIDWQGDAGLLIGKEGQTLIAIQYLASRIISRLMQASLRVRLDIGDYRAKQTERLRELAANLAEKARKTGKSYSTKPLTSYHRRQIHMSLQDEKDIQTRSTGDGPLKRVIISPRRV